MRILSIDPGVTSGYCLATTKLDTESDGDGIVGFELEPFQMVDEVDDVWDRLVKHQPRYIVCEDFEFRQRSRAGLVLFSVQVIGVIRLYGLRCQHQTSVTLQKAAQGKSYYSNTQLKNLGVYKPGANWEHAMDATRHLLHWLTFAEGYQFVQGKDIKDLVKLI